MWYPCGVFWNKKNIVHRDSIILTFDFWLFQQILNFNHSSVNCDPSQFFVEINQGMYWFRELLQGDLLFLPSMKLLKYHTMFPSMKGVQKSKSLWYHVKIFGGHFLVQCMQTVSLTSPVHQKSPPLINFYYYIRTLLPHVACHCFSLSISGATSFPLSPTVISCSHISLLSCNLPLTSWSTISHTHAPPPSLPAFLCSPLLQPCPPAVSWGNLLQLFIMLPSLAATPLLII